MKQSMIALTVHIPFCFGNTSLKKPIRMKSLVLTRKDDLHKLHRSERLAHVQIGPFDLHSTKSDYNAKYASENFCGDPVDR